MNVSVEPGSFFRRAEGLTLACSACRPDRVRVTARRSAGDTVTEATAEDLALLCGLSTWKTAAQLGVEESRLLHWTARDALFHAPQRPPRDLAGGPLPSLEGRVRLRVNAWPRLLVHHDGKVTRFPFMPRAGSLERTTLAGMHVSVFEHGRATHAVEFTCCDAHALQWRDLLPALLQGVDVEEDRPLLALLDRAGLLEAAPEPARWDGEPRVTWLGHAAVLVETSGKRVLVDPLWHPISVPTRPWLDVPPDPRGLGPVDAVLITHGDNDHLNPQALSLLPREVPVFIPRVEQRKPWQVDLRGVLRVLGFQAVHELSWWESHAVGDVKLRAAPFVGEDWGLALPSCTWVVESPGFTVYLSADSMESPESLERIGREHRVDLALLGVTGNAETFLAPPGLGYGDFYALWIPAQRRNEWVQLCAGPEESARAAVRLGARRAFGYAAGAGNIMTLAYSDRGTHGELARLLSDAGHPSVPVSLPLGVPVPAASL